MAEFVFRDLLSREGLAERFVVASSGTSGEHIGDLPDPRTVRELSLHGIGVSGKTSRRLLRSDFLDYDYIVCMDNANLRNLRRMTDGDPDGKISLMLDHAGRSGQEVADPWYTGDFEATWRNLYEGLTGLLSELG